VRAIAWRGSRDPTFERSGPGPALPFSPIRWQPRQPDDAATDLPASSRSGTSISMSVGEPASAPSIVRKAIIMITRIPAVVAIGRLSGWRSGLRS
jgi:hypothetical protein